MSVWRLVLRIGEQIGPGQGQGRLHRGQCRVWKPGHSPANVTAGPVIIVTVEYPDSTPILTGTRHVFPGSVETGYRAYDTLCYNAGQEPKCLFANISKIA